MFGLRLTRGVAFAAGRTVSASAESSRLATSSVRASMNALPSLSVPRHFSSEAPKKDVGPSPASSTNQEAEQRQRRDPFLSVTQLIEPRQRAFERAQPASRNAKTNDLEEAWRTRPLSSVEQRPFKPLDGRMVDFDANRQKTFGSAYQNMQTILRRNNVRYELQLGERYEKPNQRRRRLASQRHRRRFADLVRQKVQLIMHLKSRGA